MYPHLPFSSPSPSPHIPRPFLLVLPSPSTCPSPHIFSSYSSVPFPFECLHFPIYQYKFPWFHPLFPISSFAAVPLTNIWTTTPHVWIKVNLQSVLLKSHYTFFKFSKLWQNVKHMNYSLIFIIHIIKAPIALWETWITVRYLTNNSKSLDKRERLY